MNFFKEANASIATNMFYIVNNQHDTSWDYCMAIGLDNTNTNISGRIQSNLVHVRKTRILNCWLSLLYLIQTFLQG